MVVPDENSVPADWERWRGSVDTNMKNVETRLGNVETKIDDLPEKIEIVVERVMNGSDNNPGESRGQPVTFKWVAEKALLPVLIGITMLVAGFMLRG